jgi:hypothetical protein
MCTFVHPPRPRRCRPRWPLSRALRSARGSRSARTASRCTRTVSRAQRCLVADPLSSCAQSMVRESLGLGYEGHEYAQSFFLADVELEEGVAEATGWERGLHAVIEADGAFLLFIRLQARLLRKRARPRPRFTVPLVDRGTCFGPTTARPAWNRSSARRSPSRNSEGRPKGRCGCTRAGHVRRSFSRSGGPQRCPEASHSRSRASRRRPPSLSRAGWSRTTPRRCRRRREQRLFTPTAVNRSHTTPRRTERSSSRATRRTATRRPAGRA